MVRRKSRKQRVSNETASHVGPKDKSTRGKKRKAQSAGEPARNRLRRTESVNQLSNSQSSDAEQQPAAGTTKSVLVSISRGESILDRRV